MLCTSRTYPSFAKLAALCALLSWSGCRSAAPPSPSQPAGELPPPGSAAPAAPVAAAAPHAPSGTATPVTPAPPYRNTIRWTTSSEVDSFGFDVFRGASEAGPFERLNAKPIAGAGTSDESHSYLWVDETIDPTKEYFYYVESISIDGVREKFTPINRARAKLQAAPPPAP